MHKIVEPRATLTVYKNRRPQVLRTLASPVTSPVWVAAGEHPDCGALFGIRTQSAFYLLIADDGEPVVADITPMGRCAIRDGKVIYVSPSGDLTRASIDCSSLQNGEQHPFVDEEVLRSGMQPSICYIAADGDWRVLSFDSGGLRVLYDDTAGSPSPKRLYPWQPKHSVDEFSAAVVEDGSYTISALFTQDNGNVHVYRHTVYGWEHQRVALAADISAFDIMGAFDIEGRGYVYGLYHRTGNYDDGTRDFVILPLVEDTLAMPPFALMLTGELNGYIAAAVSGDSLYITDGSTIWSEQVPEYIKRTTGDVIDDVSDFNISLSHLTSNGTISLKTWNAQYDIEQGDAVVLSYSRDGGTTWQSIELIADDKPTLSYRGASKALSLRVMQRATWLLSRSRLPNYIEIRGPEMVVDLEPGKRETLYPAKGGQFLVGAKRYSIDTWVKPVKYTEPGVIAIEDTIEHAGSERNPFKYHNGATNSRWGFEFRPKHKLYVNKAYLDVSPFIRVLGWSRADDANGLTPEITVKLRVSVWGSEKIITLGTQHFAKTWNGTAPGVDYMDFGLPADFPAGDVEIVGVIFVSKSRGEGVTIIGNIYIGVTKLGKGSKCSRSCTWTQNKTEDGGNYLETCDYNRECGVFSTTPYSFEASIEAAAEMVFFPGATPNPYHNANLGVIVAAKDLQNFVGFLYNPYTKSVRLVKAYKGVWSVVAETTHDFGSNIRMLVRYEGGLFELYEPGLRLASIPGTLVMSYEWQSSNGKIAEDIEEKHVGVYYRSLTGVIQVLAWDGANKLITASNEGIMEGMRLKFSGDRLFTVSSIVNTQQFPDGPWQLRNIYNWSSRYSYRGLSGWAVEFQKLDWDGPVDYYNARTVYTDTGYEWEVRATDEKPYITTGGVIVELHNRIRTYSSDISGSESIGCSDKVFVDGPKIVGEFKNSEGAYVSPPEIGTVVASDKISIRKWIARERGAFTLQDLLVKIARYAGVEPEIAGNPRSGGDVWL